MKQPETEPAVNLALVTIVPLVLGAPGLQLLEPPVPSTDSYAAGVSADGRVVVGEHSSAVGVFAYRAVEGVVVDLGDLEGGLVFTSGRAVTDAGEVFGTGYSSNVVEPGDVDGVQVGFSYVDDFEILADLTGNEAVTNVAAVSADGRTVVGGSWPSINGDFVPFVVEDGIATALPLRATATRGEARGISADGSVILCADDSADLGFSSGYLVVDRAVGKSLPIVPADISGDGLVVVGFVPEGDFVAAIRIVDGGDNERLGELPGGSVSSEALAASFDGSVVVGRSSSGVVIDDPDSEEAFIWTAATGVRLLADVAREAGINLAALDGGYLGQATDVSADGTVIVGNAVVGDPQQVRAFVLTLPPAEGGDEGEGEGEGEREQLELSSGGGGCGCGVAGQPVWLGLVALLARRRRHEH